MGKLAVWLIYNFDICSCSLLLTYREQWLERNSILKCGALIKMMESQVRGSQLSHTEHADRLKHNDMTELGTIQDESACLCYLNHVVFKLRLMPCQFPMLRGQADEEMNSRVGQEFKIGFDIGYLKDSLHKTTVTDEEEQFNEGEHRNKSFEAKAKVHDQIGVTAGGSHAELEKLPLITPTTHKRVRKVATELMSDMLIRLTPKESNSRTPALLQDSYLLDGFLIGINTIQKHFISSRDMVHEFSSLHLVLALGSLRRRTRHCPKELSLSIQH
ncbi:hypothetical protein Cgig2_025320 [Carnegiea gigantea]|uniref:Uncharacterized protein n=1 Tax=Carnegiea gigantea TaxID=171969 RepID=A0A9Q1JZV3_9CARY|nr:hypothetical protein Cgig2_025320 [Carnegiea gigantea]